MRVLSHIGMLGLLLAAASTARAGDVIDRIVATVNGHIILQSDWDDAVRYQAFIEGHPLSSITEQDRGRALDRLIDQELVREQAQGAEVSPPPAEEVQQRIQELQKQHAATSVSAWQSALAQYGFAQKQIEASVTHDLSILRQVEARLRPAVQITPQTIESYYQNTFLPQLRKAGGQDVPLAQVAARIREILTQQKVNELFTSWLQSLRSESKISIPASPSSPPSPSGGQGQ